MNDYCWTISALMTKGTIRTMNDYCWTIDSVMDEDDFRCVGVVGPRKATMTHDEIKNHPLAQKFRLYDDDDNLIASGYYVGSDGEEMFGPLDDYGLPNFGCSYITYFDAQKGWEIL